MERRFYIYAHINPANGQVFYIGKGTGNRVYSKVNRSAFWNNTVNKYGLQHQILIDSLTNAEAIEKEKEFISKYGRKDKGGCLVNLTDGGEGLTGYKPTAETLLKKSIAIKGRIIKTLDVQQLESDFVNGTTINQLAAKHSVTKTTVRKQLSAELRQEINKQRRGKGNLIPFSSGNDPWNKGKEVFKGIENPFYGKEHSEQSKQKMAAKKEKPLICLNTGIIYKSTLEAADKTGIHQPSIAKVARGVQKQAKGLVFKYL